MRKLLALVSDQGTACSETALCDSCHGAHPDFRIKIQEKAARDIPDPRMWHDCTGNEALTCNHCGYPKLLIWVRVGDAGEYESFDSLDDALDYLNELHVGHVTRWIDGGMGVGIATPNYHGQDFISLFWGDENSDLTDSLDADERMEVEEALIAAYL